MKCNTSSTFEAGKFTSQQSHWWTSLQHTHRPNFLMIGQSHVEEVLRHQLDIPVTYSTQVNSIAESSSHVVVTTDTGKTIVGKYAIAADGARSFVRTTLGIPFVGTKPEMIWAVLDTFIETDFPTCPEIITFQKDGQSRVSWIPRERGMNRFYILLNGEITQEKAEASLTRSSSQRRKWFSTFEIKERVADTFISKNGHGRFLLAGDATHVHAVNGGQGLNTGIADAFSLAWRLAFVIKGHGGPLLLKSYDEERRTTAAGVIDVAAKLVRMTIRTALEYVDIIEKNAGYITGMGVAYPPTTPLVHDSKHGDFTAGHRCPDVWVTELPATSHHPTLDEPARRRLYELFGYGKFKVLFIGKQDPAAFEAQAIEWQQQVEVWHIHSQNERLSTLIHEYSADWVTPDEEAVVVVRPDLYVGYVGTDAMTYLQSAFA
ncbi:monooxygenase [Aspergillus ellipticus CBS 707.79]|uniref:Monooxygenase n=1 Tax=Aspergillus ellipticus CBS 707.79 TaxID=1448320 RepID=A0A319CQ79_9EURO|nr:monooxygenase [Aspergillus ellipticus CBS 707.79]